MDPSAARHLLRSEHLTRVCIAHTLQAPQFTAMHLLQLP